MSQARIAELERVLDELDLQWEIGDTHDVPGLGECCVHPDTDAFISNPMYDDLVREFQQLAPKHDRFTRPGGSYKDSGAQKMKHDPPMRSISKASHEDLDKQTDQLVDWLKKTTTALGFDGEQHVSSNCGRVKYPRHVYYAAFKLDGVALALYYENGELVTAGTRPRDGINGEDVTEQVKFIDSIPNTIPDNLTLCVRGELVCLKPDFEKVQAALRKAGEKERANERNHTAGAIRNFKDPSKVKDMRLTFIAYGVEGHENADYDTERDRAIWVNKTLNIRHIRVEELNFDKLEELEKVAETLDYRTDGVVIGVNNLSDAEDLGYHGDVITGNPRYKIAWKFREEQASPVNDFITYHTGRTGVIKPVANFQGVQLADTNVQRATLHNADFMRKMRIGEGTQIVVIKAGNIIPKVVGVVKGQKDPEFPKECPSCKGPVDSSGVELRCDNEQCPARLVRSMNHFLSELGILGLGESKVEDLMGGGAVKTYADFFSLTLPQAVSCGFSVRQALIAIAGIHMIKNPDKEKDNVRLTAKVDRIMKKKKEVPFGQLIASLGIPTIGSTTGKALSAEYKNFNEIAAASVAELSGLDDIGDKTAQVIHDWFKVKDNLAAANALLDYIEPQLPVTGPLTGYSFCLSGTLDGGKKKWKDAIEKQGGDISSGVSRKISYLVAGDGSGDKSEKAKKYGVPIINVTDLEGILTNGVSSV